MGHQTTRPLQIAREADRVRIRLHRAERYNALDLATLGELVAVLGDCAGEQRPLLLEGDGDLFSLGADIRELVGFDGPQAAAYSRLGQQAVRLLEAWPGVTVAHLSGYALGTGLELALGCDLLVGSATVRLGLPGLAWAMVPCLGGLRRLQQRVGSALSADLFLRGEVLDGEAALFSGLLDRMVADQRQLDEVMHLAGDYPTGAVAAIRELRLRRHGVIDVEVEAGLFAESFASGECQRRLSALL